MAIVRVQHAADSASGPPHTFSFVSPTASGNCVLVGIASRNGLSSVTSVTDTASNTYTAVSGTNSISTAGSLFNEFWIAKNITGGFTDISINYTPSVSIAAFIIEYSGVSTVTPTGVVGILNDQNGGTFTSPSLTTSVATSAVVALINNNGNNVTSVASPWSYVNGIDLQAVADYIPGSSGTFQTTFSPSIGNFWCSSGVELLAPTTASKKKSSMFLVF